MISKRQLQMQITEVVKDMTNHEMSLCDIRRSIPFWLEARLQGLENAMDLVQKTVVALSTGFEEMRYQQCPKCNGAGTVERSHGK